VFGRAAYRTILSFDYKLFAPVEVILVVGRKVAHDSNMHLHFITLPAQRGC